MTKNGWEAVPRGGSRTAAPGGPLRLITEPSEGAERKVTNGVGVFDTAVLSGR